MTNIKTTLKNIALYFFNLTQGGIYSIYRQILSDMGYVSNASYIARKTSKRLSRIPQEKYPELLKASYERITGYSLDLNNPKTFTQKMQWIKLYDATPLKTQLADKYAMRKWVAEKIGEEYLVPLIGCWDNFKDIDFSSLPNKFILKANHGCNMNIIVEDKNKFNKRKAAFLCKDWLKTNFAFIGKAHFELHYKNIPPKILAEEYLETPNGILLEYRVLCFNGKPECMYVGPLGDMKMRDFYDLNWNKLPFKLHYPNFKKPIKKPANLSLMLELAEKLSADFCYVRVDFYEHQGRLYLGELTFTSFNGMQLFEPKEWDTKLGNLIKLPKD